MAHTPVQHRDNWAKAERIKADSADAAQRLRTQRDLSTEGRRRQIAALHVATRDKLAELHAADQQVLVDHTQDLVDALFKPAKLGRTPAVDLAERDAMARCQSISSPAECRRMLTAAAQLDDRSLSRAAARRAATLHDDEGNTVDREKWAGVIDEWAASTHAPPFARDNIAELLAIENEQLDPITRFASAAHYRPTVPNELRGQVHRVDQLAAQADESTDRRPPTAAEQAGTWLTDRVHVTD